MRDLFRWWAYQFIVVAVVAKKRLPHAEHTSHIHGAYVSNPLVFEKGT